MGVEAKKILKILYLHGEMNTKRLAELSGKSVQSVRTHGLALCFVYNGLVKFREEDVDSIGSGRHPTLWFIPKSNMARALRVLKRQFPDDEEIANIPEEQNKNQINQEQQPYESQN
jgi:hypothetical protein